MPRFFVGSEQICEGIVTLSGSDAHHISRSLRMAAGEKITVCDFSGREYDCVLSDFLPDAVTARILSSRMQKTEPPCAITLFQALPKGDKMDTVIQKAVECGVNTVVPFESERCVARSGDAEPRKAERRNRIAAEAAKQCGRGILPTVKSTVSFDDMLRQARMLDAVFFCYEGDGTVPIGTLLQRHRSLSGTIGLVVGSEGGFSAAEAGKAAECGFLMTGLGKRILRTETASGFALACISCVLELSEEN